MQNTRNVGIATKAIAMPVAFIIAAAGWVQTADAQYSRDEYLHFVPLENPRLSQQTPASASFHLFGDAGDPNYRDEAPRDGIDDGRFAVLEAIGLRFAPFLVQNTYSAPMDFKALMRMQPSFPMYVDVWDLSQGTTLRSTGSVDVNALGRATCPGDAVTEPPRNPSSPDCRVVELLRQFDPYLPTDQRSRTTAVPLDRDEFTILYFDMPGFDPDSWKEVYRNPNTKRLREPYRGLRKTYAHPFIHEIPSVGGGPSRYDFIIQY